MIADLRRMPFLLKLNKAGSEHFSHPRNVTPTPSTGSCPFAAPTNQEMTSIISRLNSPDPQQSSPTVLLSPSSPRKSPPGHGVLSPASTGHGGCQCRCRSKVVMRSVHFPANSPPPLAHTFRPPCLPCLRHGTIKKR